MTTTPRAWRGRPRPAHVTTAPRDQALRDHQVERDVAGHVDLASWVDALLAFLLGTQIAAVLDPANVTPAHLERS
ncbi:MULTISPECIES: hypothetical protein [Kocuria]|uniref:hypothetical protein n=1 Tax=Kocuria TaxID=57493 RepID=UPI0011A1432E|nr:MULTISPECIES: hypothetical protein [Kocuria]QIR70430.1 hypothetical protein HBK84_10680 [Kocuria sp. KD4]